MCSFLMQYMAVGYSLFHYLLLVVCIYAYSMTIILPIMLALCLMLSGIYYAQSYAGIIGWCLAKIHEIQLEAE